MREVIFQQTEHTPGFSENTSWEYTQTAGLLDHRLRLYELNYLKGDFI